MHETYADEAAIQIVVSRRYLTCMHVFLWKMFDKKQRMSMNRFVYAGIYE